MEKDKNIKEAHDKWEEIISDEIARDRALRLEIAELDRNTAIKHARRDGYNEGSEANLEKIILSMFNKKMSIEDIARYTEISVEKVQSILEKHSKNV